MKIHFIRFAPSIIGLGLAVGGCETPAGPDLPSRAPTVPTVPSSFESSPADGARDVPLGVPLSITFRPTVSRSQARINIAPKTPGTFEWITAESSTTVIFRTTSPWIPETAYSVSVDVPARDPLRKAVRTVFQFGFTTGKRYVLEAWWGSTGDEPGQFRIPYGSDIDDQNRFIYITDCRNHRVQKFTLDGTYVAGWGRFGTGPGELNIPADIKLNSEGDVFVVEERNHRVQKFTSDGQHIGFIGSFGTGDGEFDNPLGVAIDSRDNIYVVDYLNDRVQKFAPDGTFLLKWGTAGVGDGEFDGPYYIEIDAQDDVYVVDRGNHRVQKFTSDGVFLRKWGRNGGDGSRGDGEGEFDFPHEVAIGPDGRVYVADTFNHRFQVFTAAGDFLFEWGGPGVFGLPKAIAVDQESNVYVADVIEMMGAYVTRWSFNSGTSKPLATFSPPDFPESVTDLGLFSRLPDLSLVSPSARFYEPEWQLWTNGAVKTRHIVLPDGVAIDVNPQGQWEFPEGTLIFKTFSYYMAGAPDRLQPIETRVLRHSGRDSWDVATYLWNEHQTEATLLDGRNPLSVPIVDYQERAFDHVIPSTGQCQACHASNTRFVIGFNELQLNSTLPDRPQTQLAQLHDAGVFSFPLPTDPEQITARDPLELSVIGYVQGNCVHCHNGFKVFDLSHPNFLANTVDVLGRRGDILIKPGSPEDSYLYNLFAAGDMPPLGVQLLDYDMIAMLHRYIRDF